MKHCSDVQKKANTCLQAAKAPSQAADMHSTQRIGSRLRELREMQRPRHRTRKWEVAQHSGQEQVPPSNEPTNKHNDSALGTNDQTDLTAWEEMVMNATITSQQWANLLAATGGSLNLKRCCWHDISWDCEGRVSEMKTRHETPGETWIANSPDGRRRTLT